MVLGKKVAIFDWEWGQIEMGRKSPGIEVKDCPEPFLLAYTMYGYR